TPLEVRTYLARAEAARTSLDGLLDVLSEAHLPLAAAPGEWDVRTHLAHLASADAPAAALLRAVATGRPASLAAEGGPSFLEARTRAIEAHAALPLPELRAKAASGRQEAVKAIAALGASHLDLLLEPPGADAWGQPAFISVRHYLAAWAVHDLSHEHAIRRAILSSPSPAALAAASRLQHRGHLPGR
ncbi:MAG: DinB family protein, partial [Gemmataceae bacterium]|nr:DinB family protein [Gemmataceae bacterium]